MKAMLLAAGRGERLRPLTDTLPKPLLPIGSCRLIEYHLLRLKQAGITEVVVNVCYLAKDIIQYLGDGSRYGVTLEYSVENRCLGTGGGVYRALTLLGSEPFWLISADIWTEYAFSQKVLAPGTKGHMLMVPNPEYHPAGDYGIDEAGKLVMSQPKYTYAGLSVIDPSLFDGCESGLFSLSPILNQAIKAGAVTAELYSSDWFNVGTPAELLKLRTALLASRHAQK